MTCFPYLEEDDFVYKTGSASGLFGLVLDSMVNYMTYSNDFAQLYNSVRAACEQDPAQVTPLYLGLFPTMVPRISWKNFISAMTGYRTEFFSASVRRNVLVAGDTPEECFVLSVFDNSIFIDGLRAAYPSATVSYLTRYNEVFDDKTGGAMLVVFDPNGPTKQQCGIVRLTVYDVKTAAQRLVEELKKEAQECGELQKKYTKDVHMRERLILQTDRVNFYTDFLVRNLEDKKTLVETLELLRPALRAQHVQDLKTAVGMKYMFMKKINRSNPEDAVLVRFEANY